MCNLHKLPTPEPISGYFGARWLPGIDPARPVGPLGSGMFLRPADGGLAPVEGQWGMIPKDSPTRTPMTKPRGAEKPRRLSTNNARVEGVAKSWTFGWAWKRGQRCLIPAEWYAEPNWETGKNIWWNQRRADGLPWALAGLWSEWTDPSTGEVVSSYTMLTRNCDDHPLLNRLHKPDPKLPADQQDKRAVVHVEPDLWDQWLQGDEAQARAVLDILPAPEFFDPLDLTNTDAILAQQRAGGTGSLL